MQVSDLGVTILGSCNSVLVSLHAPSSSNLCQPTDPLQLQDAYRGH